MHFCNKWKTRGFWSMNSKPQIEDVLREEGMFVSTTVGVSMLPMLRNRKDTIIVTPYEGRLKKYDVPLYKRGSAYILHRIIEVRSDSYVICGDNCIEKEYGITDEQILGVLTGFYRGDKKVNMDGLGYKLYVRVWSFLYPVRKLYAQIKSMISRAGYKIQRGKKDV